MNKEIENKLNRWLWKADLDEALRGELESLARIAGNSGDYVNKAVEAQTMAAAGKTEQPQAVTGDAGAAEVAEAAVKELEDRFYKDLEFGTGGLRGLLGAGTNRLNIYTVRKATQGIADYIKTAGLKKAVAISYDSRMNSRLFAENTAGVMLANGIDVFLYDELMPAPALSFATRHHSCSIGIMITASHNPKDYNGYKVYNGRGCQVTLEQADDILAHIEKTDIFNDVKFVDIEGLKPCENSGTNTGNGGGTTTKRQSQIGDDMVNVTAASDENSISATGIDDGAVNVTAASDENSVSATGIDDGAENVTATPDESSVSTADIDDCLENVTYASDENSVSVTTKDDGEENATTARGESSIPATVTWMADETKEAYLQAVMSQSLGVAKNDIADLKVTYTPLNGAGNKPVREMMHRLGVKDENISVVSEQENPDGSFPTCPYPNPEKKEALMLGLALCENTKSDILIATDPDSDRLGLAVRDYDIKRQSQIGDAESGRAGAVGDAESERATGASGAVGEAEPGRGADSSVKILNGNEVGLLMLDFICAMKQRHKSIPQNPVVVRTMVTTQMTDDIARHYGIGVKTTLTGFKFIGELIGQLEDEGREQDFVFGFEESCGYLSGTYVRDKDGVNAALLACEMAAYYKARGMTLIQRMEQLYREYGYCGNSLLEFVFKGADGMKKMAEIMARFRGNPPKGIMGSKVIRRADYMKQEIYIKGDCTRCDLVAGTKPTGLPKSDVMEFGLANGATLTIRPSGTEPKLKIYIFARSESEERTQEIIGLLRREMTEAIESI